MHCNDCGREPANKSDYLGRWRCDECAAQYTPPANCYGLFEWRGSTPAPSPGERLPGLTHGSSWDD